MRTVGLDFFLPHLPEPDRQVAQQVILFERGVRTPTDAAVMTKYPWLLARLASLGFEMPLAEESPRGLPLEGHLARCAAVSLRVRAWSLLFGVLAVPLTWWLARRLLSPGPALLAAALAATSLLA